MTCFLEMFLSCINWYTPRCNIYWRRKCLPPPPLLSLLPAAFLSPISLLYCSFIGSKSVNDPPWLLYFNDLQVNLPCLCDWVTILLSIVSSWGFIHLFYNWICRQIFTIVQRSIFMNSCALNSSLLCSIYLLILLTAVEVGGTDGTLNLVGVPYWRLRRCYYVVLT